MIGAHRIGEYDLPARADRSSDALLDQGDDDRKMLMPCQVFELVQNLPGQVHANYRGTVLRCLNSELQGDLVEMWDETLSQGREGAFKERCISLEDVRVEVSA